MSINLNKTTFTLAELYELRDAMEDAGAPQWKLNNLDKVIEDAQKQWVSLAGDQYGKTADRTTNEVETITRIANKLAEAAAGVLEDMRDGRIPDESEAAKRLAAIQRDVNNQRRQLPDAQKHESRAWESVNVEPDEYQQRVMERFPALAGRARIVLDEEELNQRPARRGRRSAPVDAPDEDDLARGGYQSRRS